MEIKYHVKANGDNNVVLDAFSCFLRKLKQGFYVQYVNACMVNDFAIKIHWKSRRTELSVISIISRIELFDKQEFFVSANKTYKLTLSHLRPSLTLYPFIKETKISYPTVIFLINYFLSY